MATWLCVWPPYGLKTYGGLFYVSIRKRRISEIYPAFSAVASCAIMIAPASLS